MRIQGHFLGHLSNDNFADVIILESVVLMTGFSFFGISNRAVAYTVFVSAFIELQSLFSKSLFSEYQTVLITIGVEVDNSQSAVNFDDLAPAGSTSRFIKVNCFKFIGESIFLDKLIASYD